MNHLPIFMISVALACVSGLSGCARDIESSFGKVASSLGTRKESRPPKDAPDSGDIVDSPGGGPNTGTGRVCGSGDSIGPRIMQTSAYTAWCRCPITTSRVPGELYSCPDHPGFSLGMAHFTTFVTTWSDSACTENPRLERTGWKTTCEGPVPGTVPAGGLYYEMSSGTDCAPNVNGRFVTAAPLPAWSESFCLWQAPSEEECRAQGCY